MKKQTLLAILFVLGIFAKSQTILPPYTNEGGYYGELNDLMRFAARMKTCQEAKQYADRLTIYAKEHPVALAQGNTINNCVEYANNKLAKLLDNCDANGTSTTDASGDVKPEDLNTINATINKSETPTESHKQKMLSALEEISEYLTESSPNITLKKIVSGKTVFFEEAYQYTIKFRLNGCNGNIIVTDIIGNNSKYNEFVKKLLLKLDGKYVVKEDGNCFTQPATIRIGFD